MFILTNYPQQEARIVQAPKHLADQRTKAQNEGKTFEVPFVQFLGDAPSSQDVLLVKLLNTPGAIIPPLDGFAPKL